GSRISATGHRSLYSAGAPTTKKGAASDRNSVHAAAVIAGPHPAGSPMVIARGAVMSFMRAMWRVSPSSAS
ncbi:MAG: hypothetical protein AAFY37_03550, partial [Pseudomonadota bacterium]